MTICTGCITSTVCKNRFFGYVACMEVYIIHCTIKVGLRPICPCSTFIIIRLSRVSNIRGVSSGVISVRTLFCKCIFIMAEKTEGKIIAGVRVKRLYPFCPIPSPQSCVVISPKNTMCLINTYRLRFGAMRAYRTHSEISR